MKSYEHNPVICRACKQELHAATPINPEDHGDLDGNFSICVHCGEVSIFVVEDEQVWLREPTMKELRYFSSKFGDFVRAFHESAIGNPSLYLDED